MQESDRLKEALAAAIGEIRSLRQQNALLSAKVETMDLCALLLRTQPNERVSIMGRDPLWLLQQAFDNLTAEKKPDEEPTAAELGAAVRRAGLQRKGMSDS